MKNVNKLIAEAINRMENHEEPTEKDWWIFRRLYPNRYFIFSKKKERLFDYLYEHLLIYHDSHPMNKDEAFTYRILLHNEMVHRNGNRAIKIFFLIILLFVLLIFLKVLFL